MRIVFKSTFVLNLFIDIKVKAMQVIKIPIIPKKGITSFKKIRDKIVTKIGAHPLATGYIKVRSSLLYIMPKRIKYRLCNRHEPIR